MPTADDYALACIVEGMTERITGPSYLHHPVMTAKGIQIGLATEDVETKFQMYINAAHQNNADAAKIFYQAIGYDGLSDGLFQQQPPWWGTLAERMDPRLSAAMFFSSLAAQKLNEKDSPKYGKTWDDYNTDATTPGGWAQMVQQSSFPDRYDERFGNAVALYNRLIGQINTIMNRPDFNEYPKWCENFQDRDGTDVDLWLLHTEQGNSNADELADYLISTTGTDNPVAYHYTGSQDPTDHGTTIVDCVDTDFASYSVGNSNNRSINFCFAGSTTEWTRKEWLDNASGVIWTAAYLFVQDCAKYPKLKTRVLMPYADPPGAADHNYCSVYLKDGNNHTDVGPNFPWDVFAAAVSKYSGGDAPAPVEPSPQPEPSSAPPEPAEEEAIELCIEQLLGPWDDDEGRFAGWPQLGENPDGTNRSLVDGVAAAIQSTTAMTKSMTTITSILDQMSQALSAIVAAVQPTDPIPDKLPAKQAPVKHTPAKKTPAKKAPAKKPTPPKATQ